MSQFEQIEVPLFPLPNVVLFPGGLLPLHIFEERYKEMVAGAIERRTPFGIVMLTDSVETRSSIRPVGVLARVRNFERLDDGRINIVTEGEERFRIVRFTSDGPRWKASVELVSDQPEPPAILDRLSTELGDVYRDAYRKGLELTGDRPQDIQLPDQPSELSFMVAYVLDMAVEEKQRLLESTSARFRLKTLIQHLKQANERLSEQVERKRAAAAAQKNGHLRDLSERETGEPDGGA